MGQYGNSVILSVVAASPHPFAGRPTLEHNAQGVGLIYRMIDLPGMFDLLGERDFY